MNRRLFIFVIILMGISLAGIILLQLFWITNAISIREEQFNKTVNEALRETVDKLESHENILLLNNKITSFSKPGLIVEHSDTNHHDYYINIDSNISYNYSFSHDDDTDVVLSLWTEDDDAELVEYKHEVRIDSLRHTVSRIKTEIDLDSISQFITHDIVFVGDAGDTVIKGPEDQYIIIKRAQDLNEAFVKMAYEIETNPIPIEQRLDSNVILTVLSDELFNKGINASFEYAVMKVDSLKLFPIISSGFDENDIDKKYAVSIFPNELIGESNFLLLQFPGRNIHLLKSMAWTLAGSLLLTIIILMTFAITIFMILRQKKLSDIKTDFINNMTHEFKTPIATISLAVDSINNPKIIKEEKEVRYYTDIIREENKRMNMQVESVLRMSLLDKHDLEFNCIESDIHVLIEQAISKLSLVLKERNGKVDFHATSADPIMEIDPEHFINAILNLLDNAIKYSEDDPDIQITTSDTPKGILISVKDHGMGMGKEVQQRIFDKFYRKSSGNIHNIKGFGLGLSYVKAIVDAFNGSISVHSEPGKGSTFEILIPGK